jgi:hypothetical protein
MHLHNGEKGILVVLLRHVTLLGVRFINILTDKVNAIILRTSQSLFSAWSDP